MVGQTVSHYRILEELGGGGMGVVYKATDLRLNRLVALKFLAPTLTQDPNANQRFRQEAQAASALDHPNICTIHEIDETDGHELFMVMAYYPGETLKHRIERGPLTVEETIEIAIQVAKALSRAHESGIVHRDIKPANLMVSAEGLVKILDFGLVKLTGESDVTRTGTTVGTVAYMSPEQIRGDDEVDARTDVWSLGVVFFEMLAGRRPFTGKDDLAILSSILDDTPPSIGSLRKGVPPELQRVLSRALDKQASTRYPSAADLLKDLLACRATAIASRAGGADLLRLLRRPVVAILPSWYLIGAGIPVVMAFRRNARARWARDEAIPQITKFIQSDNLIAAFTLAKQVERSQRSCSRRPVASILRHGIHRHDAGRRRRVRRRLCRH